MSTRSMIGIQNADGSVKTVYCHWDGYPEYNGRMLLNHYNDRKIAENLLKKGDFSSLQKNISDIEYYVDRGDTDVESVTYKNVAEFSQNMEDSWCEYFYILDAAGSWYVSDGEMFGEGENRTFKFVLVEDILSDPSIDISKRAIIIDCEGNKNMEIKEFVETVRNSIVKVEFEKSDGSLTERHVTLSAFLIPDDKKPKSDESQMTLDEMSEKDFVRVFSITDNGWRTVKPSKIKTYSKGEVEFAKKDGKFVLSLDME
jgi:hypothetical protein